MKKSDSSSIHPLMRNYSSDSSSTDDGSNPTRGLTSMKLSKSLAFSSKSWSIRPKKFQLASDHDISNRTKFVRSKSIGLKKTEWHRFIGKSFSSLSFRYNKEKEKAQPSQKKEILPSMNLATQGKRENLESHRFSNNTNEDLSTNTIPLCFSPSDASVNTIKVSNTNDVLGSRSSEALSSLLMEQKSKKPENLATKFWDKLAFSSSNREEVEVSHGDENHPTGLNMKASNHILNTPKFMDIKFKSHLEKPYRRRVCRLDGLHFLSLGPVESMLPAPMLVLNTLYMSTSWKGSSNPVGDIGDPHPSMVLEGFLSSGEDRFIVHINSPPPSVDYVKDDATETDRDFAFKYDEEMQGDKFDSIINDGNEKMNQKHEETRQDLDAVLNLWGSENPPPMCCNQKQKSMCCPMDIDENLFIIDHLNHLSAVHMMATDALENGRFDEALEVFHKILHSHKAKHGERHYLVGSALHNIGVINLWAGRFHDSFLSFKAALFIRSKVLPHDHPAIIITLVSCGMALFGRGIFSGASVAFAQAYKMRCRYSALRKNRTLKQRRVDDIERGKFLNNLGCAQFKAGDLKTSHTSFTNAFEIQNMWLNGKINSFLPSSSSSSQISMTLGKYKAPIIANAGTILCNIGQVYVRRDESDKATFVFEEALKLQSTISSPKSQIVQIMLNNIEFVKRTKKRKLGIC